MKKLIEFLIYAGAFYGVVFLIIWMVDPKSKGPTTARTCVELIERIQKRGRSYTPTRAESLDLEMCEEAYHSERPRGRY